MSVARSLPLSLGALVLAASLAGAACSHHSMLAHDAGGGGTSGAAGTTSAADASALDEGGGQSGAAGTIGTDGGPNNLDAADATMATRLVPHQLEAPGTPPLVIGIFDTKEKTVCRFVPDALGTLRCLPPAPALDPSGTFADDACTKPVYEIETGALAAIPADALVALPQAHMACAPDRYDLGTVIPLAADAPEWLGPACTPQGSFIAAGYTHVTAQTVSLDRWATGTIVDGPLVAGRLRIAQVETADGARFDDHVVDTRWAKTCDLSAKRGACVPAMLPDNSTFFGDARCAGTPLVLGSTCDDSAFIASSGAQPPYHAIGTRWTGAVFERRGACQARAATFSTTSFLFTLGAALDGDPVMPVNWTATGAGRLQVRALANGAAASVPVANTLTWNVHTFSEPRFHDAVAGVDCNPVWTPDGTVRCVPTTVKIIGPAFFVDSACKTPAFLCYDADCATTPAMVNDADWTNGLHSPSINMLVSVPTVFASQNGTCGPGITMATFTFGLGAQVPWDTFPPLTEINAR